MNDKITERSRKKKEWRTKSNRKEEWKTVKFQVQASLTHNYSMFQDTKHGTENSSQITGKKYMLPLYIHFNLYFIEIFRDECTDAWLNYLLKRRKHLV